MCRYSFFFLTLVLFTSCNIEGNKKNNSEATQRNFDKFHYVYHFYKHELDASHIQPDAYKPRAFNISGRITAQLYKEDTLIRFVYRSTSEKRQGDSTVELFRRVKLEDKEYAIIPTTLLGCKFLGVYNSSKEDIPDNFYYCFYTNDQNDLLNVVHLYKAGNVSAAFYYSKDSIDPTIRYKDDVARILAADRPLNNSDTAVAKWQ